MIPFFVFLFWLLVLVLEGTLIASLILQSKKRSLLSASLGLPLGALANAIIIFLCTFFGIPLFFWSVFIGHTLILFLSAILFRRQSVVGFIQYAGETVPAAGNRLRLIARAVCITLLSLQLLFSFVHGVLLPTYHIDSLTNWTMRSKVSFYDHAVAFDATEVRGVAKPQYPILFHALQITVNEGNRDWNDRSANAIHFFLTCSLFIAIFLLLQKKKGTDSALLAVTLLTSIPLFAFHLSQGYGDLPLVLFLCLSFLTLWIGSVDNDRRWLMLSAVFVAASVWTKSEGLFVGWAPWLLLVLLAMRTKENRLTHRTPLIVGFLLSLPFPLFLLSQGMGLTPHASDSRIEWHPEVIDDIFSGLFASGSMGAVWYGIAVASTLVLWLTWKKDERADRSVLLLGLWGFLSLLIILGTYIFTPNAAFLANGESYYRQLMIPAALMILWICTVYKPKNIQ
ncbi:glycosyltransferase family 39 protein [Candidatus Peribacteria bacterium]|nr:MAG: glycosyltransferase family 39 protein [Candidatus Peribacteria bacterium]